MRYILLLFLAFLFSNSIVQAQVADSLLFQPSENSNPISDERSTVDPATLQNTRSYQSEDLSVKKFDEDKWRKIVGNTDYTEGQRPERKPSMRDSSASSAANKNGKRTHRAYEKDDDPDQEIDNREDSSITVGPLVGLLLKIFFYAAVIAIIGYILYSIFKNTTFKTTSKDAKIGTPDFSDHVEDISELDVDSLLKKTLAAGDFRLAIRMYFLGLLKKLNEDGIIVWKKDKTNRDYLNELLAKAYYFDEVQKLTLAYEQVWYGDHTLPADSYQQLIADFKAIDQKLHNTKAQ